MQPLRLILTTHGPDETIALGRYLGRLLDAGDVVALVGDLGAGKTCLVQGIAQGLDVPESSYVRSPSFVILNIHPGRCDLFHLDLYRLGGEDEFEDLGFTDMKVSLKASDVQMYERVGWSVAIDGRLAVLGAPHAAVPYIDAGRGHVFLDEPAVRAIARRHHRYRKEHPLSHAKRPGVGLGKRRGEACLTHTSPRLQ